MRRLIEKLLASFVFVTGAYTPALAQSADLAAGGPAAFASENAILDTAIPFAIGAREAQQALRGAFGWPNFQEGLVEGVYFRFDPDGYARFAPTPRLDVDVFEVICRPRTYACAGRKEGLEVFLTERGQLQIKLAEALGGDLLFVSEGVSEIQVPERILQPLDVQLELLLSAGGELVIRRGGTEVSRTSLKGFAAVSAYLRWIAARQDYAVLPRGWPVPNAEGRQESGGVTQAVSWSSPMPQPQVVPPGFAPGIAPATTVAPLTTAPLPAVGDALESRDAAPSDALSNQELRAELETLKQIILRAQTVEARIAESAAVAEPPVNPPTSPINQDLAQEGPTPLSSDATYQQIFMTLQGLQAQLNALQPPAAVHTPTPADPTAITPADHALTERLFEDTRFTSVAQPADGDAENLEFLTTRLGLDTATALSVLRLASGSSKPQEHALGLAQPRIDVEMNGPQDKSLQLESAPLLYQNDLVDQILEELEAELASAPRSEVTLSDMGPAQAVTEDEYVLLSRYFKSVVLPAFQGNLPELESYR